MDESWKSQDYHSNYKFKKHRHLYIDNGATTLNSKASVVSPTFHYASMLRLRYKNVL